MGENNYCVYVHVSPSDKHYVGQTKLNFWRRWGADGKGYKKDQPYFHNAINKYGWDNFEHVILKENLTKEEADYWEKYYINLWDCTNRSKGYNLTNGGDGSKGAKRSEETKEKIRQSKLRTKLSEETKRKIGTASKGHYVSKEVKKKIGDAQRGEKNHNYGKTASEDARRKMSEAKSGEKNHNYGKHLSEDIKKKISEARKRYLANIKNTESSNEVEKEK